MISKSLLLIAGLFLAMSYSQAAHHFAEVYKTNGVWMVDHFEMKPGKLQELIESRSFEFQFEAIEFSRKVRALSDKAVFSRVSTESTRPLWTVTNAWSEDWEDKYAAWVGKTLTADFFTKNNFATDCADVAYALRWIFARNHGLPAAATLAGSGIIASHLSAKASWESLPGHKDWDKDRRFLAGLNWLLDNVYTKTLYKDAYPVRIDKSTLRPGLINLMDGHTEVFQQVSYQSTEVPFIVMSSTVPRAVRVLATRVYMTTEAWPKETGGLLQFRWPVISPNGLEIIPKDQMPAFSMEQYEKDLCSDELNFTFCLFKKLGITFKPDLIFNRVTSDIYESVKARDELVKEGLKFCQSNDCSPGTQGWEDHSTPTRDGRLLTSSRDYQTLMYSINKGDDFYNWTMNTRMPVAGNHTFQRFFELLELGFVSFDPRDSIESRWAASPGAVVQTVTNRFTHENGLRKKLVEKAEVCRRNPKSCESPSALNEYSSIELDYKRRSLVHNLLNFCKTNQCPDYRLLTNEYERIWFQSPFPWDPIHEREGRITRKKVEHLLHASSVQRFGTKYLLLDSSRIYDIERREVLPMTNIIGYDESTGQLIQNENDEIVTYDHDLNIVNTFSLKRNLSTYFNTHYFGNGLILFHWPVTENYEGRLIDLNKGRVAGTYSFRYIVSDYDHKGSVFLGLENSALLLETTGKTIQERVVPNISGLMDILHFDDGKYLLKLDYKNMAILDGTSMTNVYEGGSSHISSINPYFKKITDWERGVSFIIDSNGKRFFENWYVDAITPLNSNYTMMNVFKADRSELWMTEGSEFKKFPLESRGILTLVGVSDDWVNIEIDKEFAIFDYLGNFIESSKVFSKSTCYFGFSSLCSNANNDLLFVSLRSGNNSDFYSTKIGKRSGMSIVDPYAYIIQQGMNPGMTIFRGTRTNGVSSLLSDSSLSVITLMPGLTLWIDD